jgi:hypothetical protein
LHESLACNSHTKVGRAPPPAADALVGSVPALAPPAKIPNSLRVYSFLLGGSVLGVRWGLQVLWNYRLQDYPVHPCEIQRMAAVRLGCETAETPCKPPQQQPEN